MLRQTALLVALVGCNTSGGSHVLDDNATTTPTPQNVAPTAEGLLKLAETIRKLSAAQLNTAVFPFYDERDTPLGKLKSSGKSHAFDPLNNLKVEIPVMERIEGSATDWRFEWLLKSPLEGNGTIIQHVEPFGIPADIKLLDEALYTANAEIRAKGNAHFAPLLVQGTSDDDSYYAIDIFLDVTDLSGVFHDFKIHQDVVELFSGIIGEKINGAVADAKDKLTHDMNQSIDNIENSGGNRVKLEDFATIVPVGG